MQPLGDVRTNFRQTQRPENATARDALTQCPQFGFPKQSEKFRLATQNYLQEFFLVSIRVAEQTNLFEQIGRQQMRLVHQKERGAALSLRFQEHALKRGEPRRLAR